MAPWAPPTLEKAGNPAALSFDLPKGTRIVVNDKLQPAPKAIEVHGRPATVIPLAPDVTPEDDDK